MAEKERETEYLLYEELKIDVIQITTRDIVCTSDVSNEGGGGFDPGWEL